MAKKYSPPDAYAFLLAAGEIDHIAPGYARPNTERCAQELERIAAMNGSYELLPADFRADMRHIVEREMDKDVTKRLCEIARFLRRIDSLETTDRLRIREFCSSLSKHWPLKTSALVLD